MIDSKGKLYSIAKEVELHLHHENEGSIWLGWDGVAGGIRNGSDCYQLTTGNDDFGNELLILDAGDTPVVVGMTKYDPHSIVVCNVNQEGLWYIKLWLDTGTGNFGDAEVYTTFAISAERITNRVVTTPSANGAGRSLAGLKMWATAKCANQDAKIIDFIIGIHEYPNIG